MKVLIIDGNAQYRSMFENAGWEITFDLNKADLVQFTGGADVSPFIYGEAQHPTTGNDPRRDLVEAGYYALCVRMGKPMAGICRGGQFLNVMNGGKMYQDVDGHAIGGTHQCIDQVTGAKIQVTSTHHQMMIPARHGDLIAYGQQAHIAKWMENGREASCPDMQHFKDAEVVWYDDTGSLCFQPHPEFIGAHSTREYYFSLLERYLGFKQVA